ncbi:hypothetical protein [Mangrovicoccus sp. HB161399]|uniref:hypothetical protein n=1 Tax=Mangrovicoccus sp. HB161399 TaxID=2720392 RepID=UPI001553D199|nr:hypothetical protein [Mangrovicoccus sp. HB161399]
MVYRITAEADRQHIEEFRANPIAPHSPGLQRMLNIMRTWTGGDQYILIARVEFAEFVIGRMPEHREDPIVVEEDMVFATREEAEWELFCRRWKQHTGESLNMPLKDEA